MARVRSQRQGSEAVRFLVPGGAGQYSHHSGSVRVRTLLATQGQTTFSLTASAPPPYLAALARLLALQPDLEDAAEDARAVLGILSRSLRTELREEMVGLYFSESADGDLGFEWEVAGLDLMAVRTPRGWYLSAERDGDDIIWADGRSNEQAAAVLSALF